MFIVYHIVYAATPYIPKCRTAEQLRLFNDYRHLLDLDCLLFCFFLVATMFNPSPLAQGYYCI